MAFGFSFGRFARLLPGYLVGVAVAVVPPTAFYAVRCLSDEVVAMVKVGAIGDVANELGTSGESRTAHHLRGPLIAPGL